MPRKHPSEYAPSPWASTEPERSSEYLEVLEKFRAASEKFRQVTERYRRREIGDEEYLEARRAYGVIQEEFERAWRKETIDAP